MWTLPTTKFKEQWCTLRCYMEKTTLADVFKKLSEIFQQSPHLTTNADKVCSVRHIKLLSDIGIREMCTVCECQLDNCKL